MHMSVCCDALYRKKWCLHFIISQVDFNYKRLFIALNANLTHNFERLLAQFILSKWASMLNVANIPATRVSVFPRFRNGFYCDLKGAEKALEQAMSFSSQRIMIIEQLRLSIICTEWRKNEAIKRAMWFLCSMLLSDAHFVLCSIRITIYGISDWEPLLIGILFIPRARLLKIFNASFIEWFLFPFFCVVL